MTQPAHQPPSEHRLARLRAWAWLWLAWLAGWLVEEAALFGALPRWGERLAARRLRVLRGMVGKLIFIAATQRLLASGWAMRAPRAFCGMTRIPGAGRVRRLIGARLRHALRGKTLTETIAALQAALAAPERLIARLAPRLARMRMRLPVYVRAAAAASASVCAPASPALADSS